MRPSFFQTIRIALPSKCETSAYLMASQTHEQKIVMYLQPNAWADGIISQWAAEDLQRRLHKQYGINIAEAETALNTLVSWGGEVLDFCGLLVGLRKVEFIWKFVYSCIDSVMKNSSFSESRFQNLINLNYESGQQLLNAPFKSLWEAILVDKWLILCAVRKWGRDVRRMSERCLRRRDGRGEQ